jgi:hypothetical protein
VAQKDTRHRGLLRKFVPCLVHRATWTGVDVEEPTTRVLQAAHSRMQERRDSSDIAVNAKIHGIAAQVVGMCGPTNSRIVAVTAAGRIDRNCPKVCGNFRQNGAQVIVQASSIREPANVCATRQTFWRSWFAKICTKIAAPPTKSVRSLIGCWTGRHLRLRWRFIKLEELILGLGVG